MSLFEYSNDSVQVVAENWKNQSGSILAGYRYSVFITIKIRRCHLWKRSTATHL